MPMGFPSYAEDEKRFRDVEREDLARAVKRAMKELRWNPFAEKKFRIVGSVPFRFHIIFLTYGAKFIVDVKDDTVFVRSEASFPLEWLDIGPHSENIRNFMEALKDALRD